MTGIHQCGDLSSSSLREFIRNKTVGCLAIVGCCYNCLSERIDKNDLNLHSGSYKQYMKTLGTDKNGRCLDETLIDVGEETPLNQPGFPMSKAVQALMLENHLFFGRSVRTAATVNLKSEKLQRNFTETMTKLYYRAAI